MEKHKQHKIVLAYVAIVNEKKNEEEAREPDTAIITSCYFAQCVVYGYIIYILSYSCRPRGLMDKASDFGSEDCEFESRRGRVRIFLFFFFFPLSYISCCYVLVSFFISNDFFLCVIRVCTTFYDPSKPHLPLLHRATRLDYIIPLKWCRSPSLCMAITNILIWLVSNAFCRSVSVADVPPPPNTPPPPPAPPTERRRQRRFFFKKGDLRENFDYC